MKRQMKRVFSACMVLVLCLAMGADAGASTIDEAEKKAEELNQQKDETQAQNSSLAEQLNTIAGQVTETQGKIETKKEEVTEAEDGLVKAKVAENTQYSNMKLRIKYMYESGNAGFIEMLVKAETLADFISTAEYVSQMSDYDRSRLLEFQDTVDKVREQEETVKQEYADLTELQDTLIAQQSQVQEVLDANNVKLADLDTQIGENAATLERLKEEAAEAERAAAEAAAAEAAAQAAAQAQASAGSSGGSFSSSEVVVSGSGEFTNPCPGASYISSEFGEYRSPSDPSHKGMDFAAGTGTPTYAAAAGTVVIANYSASAGNWVVIDHGNGIVTKYMHHDAICVSAGQYVEKGQQIGVVGTTGWSTGPHLHFQVELGNVPVNPRNYL